MAYKAKRSIADKLFEIPAIHRAAQIVRSNGRGAHEEEIARLVEEGHRALDAAQFAPQASGMLRELCLILTSRRA